MELIFFSSLVYSVDFGFFLYFVVVGFFLTLASNEGKMKVSYVLFVLLKKNLLLSHPSVRCKTWCSIYSPCV